MKSRDSLLSFDSVATVCNFVSKFSFSSDKSFFSFSIFSSSSSMVDFSSLIFLLLFFCSSKLSSRSSISSFKFFRSEEHTSELQSRPHLVCRLLLEKKKQTHY